MQIPLAIKQKICNLLSHTINPVGDFMSSDGVIP